MKAIHARGIVAVGIDGSPEALAAARYAVAIAHARHVDLLVVHAYQLPIAALEVTRDMIAATRTAAAQVATSVVSQLTLPATMRVGTLVDVSSPAALLCRVAETAAVVVIGAHHFNLADQLLTGRVTSLVAAKATCPVVIVPGPWLRRRSRRRSELGSIVVALDGETPATTVLDFAFAEAERSGLSITALHALSGSAEPTSGLDPRLSIAEILAGHEARTSRHLRPHAGSSWTADAGDRPRVGRRSHDRGRSSPPTTNWFMAPLGGPRGAESDAVPAGRRAGATEQRATPLGTGGGCREDWRVDR